MECLWRGYRMFLNSETEDNDSESTPSKAWAIILGICLFPVYLIFSAFGMLGKGTAAACALGVLIIAIRMNLEFINRVWFWCVIALIAVINILLVIYIPFPNKNYTFP